VWTLSESLSSNSRDARSNASRTRLSSSAVHTSTFGFLGLGFGLRLPAAPCKSFLFWFALGVIREFALDFGRPDFLLRETLIVLFAFFFPDILDLLEIIIVDN
jgi:hypothetical protein